MTSNQKDSTKTQTGKWLKEDGEQQMKKSGPPADIPGFNLSSLGDGDIRKGRGGGKRLYKDTFGALLSSDSPTLLLLLSSIIRPFLLLNWNSLYYDTLADKTQKSHLTIMCFPLCVISLCWL